MKLFRGYCSTGKLLLLVFLGAAACTPMAATTPAATTTVLAATTTEGPTQPAAPATVTRPPATDTPSPATAAPTETMAPAPTMPPTATAAATPTAELPYTLLTGPAIDAAGVAFTLPAGFDTIHLMKEQDDRLRARFQFELEGYCGVTIGCLTIFDAAKYAATIPGGSFNVDLVRRANAGESVADFPTVGAAILVLAKLEPLTFGSGAGLRALVMRGQDSYLANNQELFYNFYGLSADERYFVQLQIPADAPFLLDTTDPAANTNTNAIPVPPLPDDVEALYELIGNYNLTAQQRLDGMAPAELVPTLTALDELASSITLKEEE